MENTEIIKRVASGLRKMDYKPDYLLFCDFKEDVYWDMPEICGIPVLRAGFMVQTGEMDECVFIPLFKNENDKNSANASWFYEGYSDWS